MSILPHRPDWKTGTTREQEVALAARIAAGGPDGVAARNELAGAHVAFAMARAKTLAPKLGMDIGDAFGAGQLGLLRAAEKFDATRGTRFLTYAGCWIDQNIRRHANVSVGAVRVPDYLHDRRLMSDGRPSPYREHAARGRNRPVSLDAGCHDARGWGHILADHRGHDPDFEADREAVRALVDRLEGRQKEAVLLYCGFEGEPLTMERIATRWRVSRQAVQQILVRAFRTLAPELVEALSA